MGEAIGNMAGLLPQCEKELSYARAQLPIDDLDSNDPWNCLDRIGNECSYLCTCEVLFQLKIVNEHWYQDWPITSDDIGNLIGLAAHEDMYKLLIQFR